MSHFDIADAIIASGWAVLFAGVWRIYPPASLILCGLAIIGVGVGMSRGKP